MKAHKQISVCLMALAVSFSMPMAKADAASVNADSPSYTDVYRAISISNPGDTVFVPAGEATWESCLTITKGITLQGAGSSKTLITAGVDGDGSSTGNGNYLIVYDPSSPQNNESFRLTGFSFNCTGRIQALKLNNLTTYPLNKIRVDHNRFINGREGTRFLLIYGTIYGVIDYNYIDKNTAAGQILDSYALNYKTWSEHIYAYGTSDNMYFENNTIVNIQDSVHDLGLGGRVVIRHNTYTHNDGAGIYSWLIMHDDQPGANYSPMGAEFYGNILYSNYPSSVCGYRGGKLAFFYNKVVRVNHKGSYSFSINERYPDNCPNNCSPPYISGSNFVTAPDKQPQHVSSGYIWNNRYDTTLIVPYVATDCCTGVGGYGPWADCCYNNNGKSGILENTDWWIQREDFDGTSGVGCGKLSSRPATCTVGVGYWATDQSCSELEGMVGADPTTPVSGVLYRCAAPNTWAEYYRPYIYPHPLTQSSNALLTPPGGLHLKE